MTLKKSFSNTSNQKSKVYLVGAGPGDPGLLTLKGKTVLEKADVVIYDYLANPVFLNYAPAHAEFINAGKRHGHDSISQAEINQLIVKKALENKIVVRLKGGDPFIFGRGGEELEEVMLAGIAFEVVPGVSSANAVPAYAGIPLTHRDFSSNVVFITATEDPLKPNTMIPWEAIAKIGTIVVLMGLNVLENVTAQLRQCGLAGATPAAAIQCGTCPNQRSILATLEDLAQKVKTANFVAPVLAIIGNVASFHDKFNWFENLPLFGQRVLVTRVESPLQVFQDKLQERGAEVIVCPTIEIQDTSDWSAFDDWVLNRKHCDWVVFTSVNGVDRCFKRLRHLGKDARYFGAAKIACVGGATAQMLEMNGLIADLVPTQQQSEGLWEILQNTVSPALSFWFPGAETMRGLLPQKLLERGAQVHLTPVYRNILPAREIQHVRLRLLKQEIHWITFTSSSTVNNFMTLLGEEALEIVRKSSARLACIGKITAATLSDHGLVADVVPEMQDLNGLVEAMCLKS